MDYRKKVREIAFALNLDTFSFFMMVYMWRYQELGDVTNDWTLFRELGIIPSYVEDYLNALQKRKEEREER